ncbi:MAG: hypothetical protein WAN36_07995 [Calditrichia bacterium]
MIPENIIIVQGGGEPGSAIASYLFQAGLPVLIVLQNKFEGLRHPVCFSEAHLRGSKQIGAVKAVSLSAGDLLEHQSSDNDPPVFSAIQKLLLNRELPVLNKDEYAGLRIVPEILIQSLPEASQMENAEMVIGLYPWHLPGKDCHLAVSIQNDFSMGRVYQQPPLPAKGMQALPVFNKPLQTVKSPIEGPFQSLREIGEKINPGESLGTVAGIEIRSPFRGQLWGLAHSGQLIASGQHMALISERLMTDQFHHFDPDHLLIAGAVLKTVLKHRHKIT